MPAEPAYSYYPERAYERVPVRAPRETPRTRIRVVPGGAPQTQASPALSPNAAFIAAAVAVVTVVIAIIAFASITLTSLSVETSMESQEIAAQIEEARDSGESMEVSQSLLTNPGNLKQQASALGMAAPETVEVIDVGVDVVACDEAGNLSLSKSLAIAVSIGA